MNAALPSLVDDWIRFKRTRTRRGLSVASETAYRADLAAVARRVADDLHPPGPQAPGGPEAAPPGPTAFPPRPRRPHGGQPGYCLRLPRRGGLRRCHASADAGRLAGGGALARPPWAAPPPAPPR